MEDFIANIFQISLVCGVCFLIAAALMYIFPPKKINWLYGYRTVASMKSNERWEFAQKYSTIQMFKASVFMILFSFTGFLFPDSVPGRLFGSFIIAIGAVCYMFITTERELKRRFKD
ncbi:SdpI family protein [Flavobacterium sp. AG291]|uniref:SdpI family protein n=1 Tax=Flavobacterium sp. AG291 TaxID=2184000 RepID=UPI000E0A4DE3|nr:SdpI family protein [Flavobacterium sp. AG291]RDI07977.1 SdpI/YhfL family protein [Flavobacterium sp. AG291]